MAIQLTGDRTALDSVASSDGLAEPIQLSTVPLEKEANRYLPIHRLPPEILISVFHLDLHLSIYSIDAETVLKTNVSRIVLLSSVCSRWRSLVVETRSLWTGIRIPLHYSQDFVATCVDRARGGPLNIIAIESDEKQEWKNWKGEGALRDFTKNVRSLSVTAHTSGPINWASDWMSNLERPLCLQELSVALPRKIPWSFDVPESLALSESLNLNTVASNLHTLHLENVDANWSECTFDRLRVLKLNNINTLHSTKLRSILATSPMLQVLEFRSNRLPLCGFRSTPEPTPLQGLKILRLYCTGIFEALRVFRVLTFAPGTYSVELYTERISVYKINMLGGYVSRTMTGLNFVTLGVGRPEGELGRALACIPEALPNLTTLCFKDVDWLPDGLAAMEQTIEKLPNLKTMRITRTRVIDVASFKDMLQRCSGGRRIELVDNKSVDADGTEHPIEPGAPLYEWILTRGLNVSFLPGLE